MLTDLRAHPAVRAEISYTAAHDSIADTLFAVCEEAGLESRDPA
jgi:hypothetical protein